MPVVLPNKTNQGHQSKSNGKNKPLLRPQDSQSSRSLGRCKDAQGCQKWVILPLVVQYLTASTGKFGLGEPKKPRALYWCIPSYAWVCSVLKTPNTFAKVGYIACLDSCFFRRLAAPKSRVLHSHQPFPTVKHHLKLPKGTANSISRNTCLNPLNPIIFSYPPVIKLMAMENPRSSEVLTGKSSKNAGLTIEAIAMFDYWRGHKKKHPSCIRHQHQIVSLSMDPSLSILPRQRPNLVQRRRWQVLPDVGLGKNRWPRHGWDPRPGTASRLKQRQHAR